MESFQNRERLSAPSYFAHLNPAITCPEQTPNGDGI